MQPGTSPPIALEPDTLAAMLAHSDLVALALARGDTLVFANAAFGRLFGRSGGVTGTRLTALAAPAHRGRIEALLRGARVERTACVVDVARSDGRLMQAELRAQEINTIGQINTTGPINTAGQGLCALFAHDVTDRSRSAERLKLLAFTDPLTGLANRALFADRLAEAAAEARRSGRSFGLIMLDLDQFKPVNDRYGHAAGDLVLQLVAARLKNCLRTGETIARLGGDEFAMLLLGVVREVDLCRIAERVLAAIREAVVIDEIHITLDASAGIAVFPAHGDTVERLVVAADMALYLAKRAGRGRFAWAGQEATGAAPPAIAWSAAHELGIPAIDAQHARLAALLEQLAAALHNGQDPKPAFQAFVRYAALHFADEERIMARGRYAGTLEHADLHRRLLADVADILLEGTGFSASVVLRYLQEWVFRHIDGPDREMAMTLGCNADVVEADNNALLTAV